MEKWQNTRFFQDVIYSDVRLYLKMEVSGTENPEPRRHRRRHLPHRCGSATPSHSGLTNLGRPAALALQTFANANTAGYLYEPELIQVRQMLRNLREQQPVAGRIVQFSGGEPTIYPYLLTLSESPRKRVYNVSATNGIKFTDLEFAQRAKEPGCALYLQFDGISDDIYLKTRGERLIEKKMKAIENVRKAGMKICLVPTIVKGFNDHQIGDILRLAIDNIDC
jgi:uncharacterized radical SAM superfamily Fe-S cluster-containing enzyme